jgi:hypothetical protein
MARSLLVVLALLLVPTAASAEDCTYEDLHGKFTITADCEGLKDHSGLGQEHKRMWLAGTWGQLQIIEISEPHRSGDLDFIMSNLGRDWGSRRTPQKVQPIQLFGVEGRLVTERKIRTTSTSYVFPIDGVNVIARAVAYGNKRKEREANLELIRKAFLETYTAK